MFATRAALTRTHARNAARNCDKCVSTRSAIAKRRRILAGEWILVVARPAFVCVCSDLFARHGTGIARVRGTRARERFNKSEIMQYLLSARCALCASERAQFVLGYLVCLCLYSERVFGVTYLCEADDDDADDGCGGGGVGRMQTIAAARPGEESSSNGSGIVDGRRTVSML